MLKGPTVVAWQWCGLNPNAPINNPERYCPSRDPMRDNFSNMRTYHISGGVVITLAVLAGVHRKLGRRFEPKQQRKEADEQTRQTWDFSEGKEALSMSYAFQNSNYRDHPPWEKDNTSSDSRPIGNTSSDSRPDTMGNHFICQNCRKLLYHATNSRGIQPDLEEEWSTYMGSDQWKDADVCPPMIRDEAQRHNAKDICGLNTDYHRQPVLRHDTSAIRMHQIALKRHISIAQTQTFSPEDQPNTIMAFSKHQHGGHGSLPIHQYHHTYVDKIQENKSIRGHQSEGILPRSSKVIVYRDIFNYNQSNMDHQGGNRSRVQRNVTFDLAMERAMFVSRKEGPYKISKTKISKIFGQKSKLSPCKVSGKGNRSSTHSRHSKIHTPRFQRSSTLKVKLNLNPLRRIQVHPKSSSNHEGKDIKRTSKKIKKDKSQKSATNIDSEVQDKEEKSKKTKITAKAQCDESSINPDESSERNPEESCSLMQTVNLLAESIKPLGTENSSDPHVSTLDLNLAVWSPEATRSLQNELQMPHNEEDLPNVYMSPVSSTVSVVQEYLSSGDGSPKRKLRLIVPEKTSSRPQTALEKKIR